jgi:tetratricopeptide (TPR) repeat protein
MTSLRANAAMCEEKWALAKQLYDTLEHFTPQDAVVWYNRAVALYNMDSVTAAWTYYTRALEMDSSFVNEDIENRYANVTGEGPGEKDTVIRTRTEIDSVNALYNRAVTYQGRGAHEKAKDLYTRVLARDPAHLRTLNNMGVLYARQGSYDSAAHYYSEVLTHAPDMAQTYVNLMSVELMRGDTARARELFDILKGKQPDSTLIDRAQRLIEPAALR